MTARETRRFQKLLALIVTDRERKSNRKMRGLGIRLLPFRVDQLFSGRNITAKLNTLGVDTPAEYYFKQTGKRATRGDNGQQWGSTTIMQLLKNQVYIGNMVQGKRKVSSFKTKKRLVTCPDDWIIVEDTHEPIIDRFTWDCVRRRMETIRRAPSNNTIKIGNTDEANIFPGIIRCTDCGAAMAFVRQERKNSGDKRFYRCSRYNNGGQK